MKVNGVELDEETVNRVESSPALKKGVAEKWLEALRGGDYKQGRGRLLNTLPDGSGDEERTFCCLGVLSDLFIEDGGEGEWGDGRKFTYQHNGFCRTNAATLPGVVGVWLDSSQRVAPLQSLNIPAGVALAVLGEDKYESVVGRRYTAERSFALTLLNDQGASFAEIADMIEASFEFRGEEEEECGSN